jgi:hypothetical protein
MKRLLVLALLLPLTGCVSTAASIVTAPVRAASWSVDKMTTSQSEADRNRGRRDRKAEEKQRKEDKKEAKRQRELEKKQAHYSDPNQ